jgi:hypothetical protein
MNSDWEQLLTSAEGMDAHADHYARTEPAAYRRIALLMRQAARRLQAADDLLAILKTTEVSEDGKEFHPVTIQSSRVNLSIVLPRILARLEQVEQAGASRRCQGRMGGAGPTTPGWKSGDPAEPPAFCVLNVGHDGRCQMDTGQRFTRTHWAGHEPPAIAQEVQDFGRSVGQSNISDADLLVEMKAVCESLSIALTAPHNEFMDRCLRACEAARSLLANKEGR